MDHVCKKILDKMISYGHGTNYVCTWDEAFDDFAASLSLPCEDVRAAVRYLKEQGYIEYQMYHSARGTDKSRGFHLSHQGLHWKYYRRKEILDYIADKWADFFAAAISLVSLIISVISLLQG